MEEIYTASGELDNFFISAICGDQSLVGILKFIFESTLPPPFSITSPNHKGVFADHDPPSSEVNKTTFFTPSDRAYSAAAAAVNGSGETFEIKLSTIGKS